MRRRVRRREAPGETPISQRQAALATMTAMDDHRVGLLVRALRRRRRWRQADLAEAAGVSQSTVSRLERGHLDALDLRVIRRMLGAVEARGELDVRWRGGLSDQLLDERHAALGVCAAGIVQSYGWQVIPEVTFQHFGERGSIDLFASQSESRAVCIIELKSAVYSYEETQRRLDAKARLAAVVAEERLGWRPRAIGVILVVEESSTNRRRLRSIEPLVRAGLPGTARDIRRWLAQPAGPLRGLWFLSPGLGRTGRHVRAGPTRIRTAASRVRRSSPRSR